MKKMVMFGGMDLRQIQGVNLVINYLIQGSRFFRDIQITKVYGGQQVIDVANGDQMPIGIDVGTPQYTFRRKIRSMLRELLSSEHYVFAMLKYYLNAIRPTKKALHNYMVSEDKADYILFHGILSAYYYYKMNGGSVPEKCAVIVHAADDDMGQLFEQFPAFKEKKQKEILAQRDYVYEHINKVVYISKKAYDNSKVPSEKKCVIYNGIDDFPYEFSMANDDKINFVCVGSMSGWKGQELVSQALINMNRKHLDKLHVYFVGDGAERANLEQQVRDGHIEEYVTFMGARKDVAEILRSQDVFIMPSKNEGLSIATIEGIRAGLFMLLTDAGGNKEVMGDKGGMVIKRDANDIKEKICCIIDERLVSKEQKERSRAHFLEYFTTEKFISDYEKMFLSL
jgi:glycosyltransferase involved in cell wall biosynthesis